MHSGLTFLASGPNRGDLFRFVSLALPLFFFPMVAKAVEPQLSNESVRFLESNCYDCHQGEDAEADLDLANTDFALSEAESLQRWVRIFDRVKEGEMPPPDYDVVEPSKVDVFTDSLAEAIRGYQSEQQRTIGRVHSRRLTRQQVERTLHDLLGIDIPLAEFLPEESSDYRYSSVSDGQPMSHFQMQSHLAVVDRALDEAFRRAFSDDDTYEKNFDAKGLARKNPKRRCREPELRKGKAVIWNGGVIFYGRLPATTAPEDGWYRFKLSVAALKPPKTGGVWSTIRSGLCVSSAPLLTHITSFEAQTESQEIELEAWLPKGHMLEVRPADATLKRGRFAGGQIGTGEGEPQNIPGIAFDRLTMRRFHQGPTNTQIRQLLFDDLRADWSGDMPRVHTASAQVDAERLLLKLAARAFRKPVDRADIDSYINAVHEMLEGGAEFHEALRFGYRAILCSPRFLYFTEQPGKLDAYDVATRLAYFLTGSSPDATLSALAASGALLDSDQLRTQTERLLSEHGGRFIEDFSAEWLDLQDINASPPNRKLFGAFDPVVQWSMIRETHDFLRHMLEENLSVVQLIDSQHTFLNSRLARYYNMDHVTGGAMQRVVFPDESYRGGLLTHGSILKVTANGSVTSPVLRGIWVSERLLGVPIPPPPGSVPAIEPDIRGATTIREQLEKHRADSACASCHKKIDPPGYALENFDAAGQWRQFYRKKKGAGNRSKTKIDASYRFEDSAGGPAREFQDIRDFRKLVASRPKQLAASMIENLVVYATGGPIEFADREVVSSIVDELAKNDQFGLRSIIHAVVASPIFLNK